MAGAAKLLEGEMNDVRKHLSRYASGPTCTQILGDLGADVWKVERPNGGEEARYLQPLRNGESSYFHAMNRNKRSITLNYTKPEGKELFLALVKEVDVVVENNAPGAMKKYGLDYESLVKTNPTLIMASITGFGQKDSPYWRRPAYDGIIQAMSGLMSVNGYADRPGVKIGPSLADIMTGYYCTMGVLAALYERTISGQGQYIDVAMLDASVASLEHDIPAYAFTGVPMRRMGNGHEAVGCTNTYDTKDGPQSVYISCSSDKIANAIADVIGRSDLKGDERYASNSSRSNFRDYIDPIINAWTQQRTRTEIIALFDAAAIPSGPVNDIADVYHDPHLRSRDMIKVFDHPVAGELPLITSPIKMSRTPARADSPGPALGDGNQYVYEEVLKKSEADYQKLKEEKVI